MPMQSSLADLNTRLPEHLPMSRFRPNIVVDASVAPWAEDDWQVAPLCRCCGDVLQRAWVGAPKHCLLWLGALELVASLAACKVPHSSSCVPVSAQSFAITGAPNREVEFVSLKPCSRCKVPCTAAALENCLLKRPLPN